MDLGSKILFIILAVTCLHFAYMGGKIAQIKDDTKKLREINKKLKESADKLKSKD